MGKHKYKLNDRSVFGRSSEFLAGLLDAMPIAVFCKDYSNGRGTFVGWNRHAEALWGLKRQQIIGKTDADFFPPEQVENFRNKDLETLRLGKTVFIEEESVQSPIGLRIVRTWKVPLGTDGIKRNFLLGVSLDLTEQKQVEADLEMERQRVVTASSLANMNEMVAGMAHEINNPLAIICGFADVLNLSIAHGNVEIPLIEHSVRGIRGAVDRIAKLIVNMRKVNRDVSMDECQPCSIRKVVNESISLFEATAMGQGIQLTVDVEENLPKVRGTETQLMQVLASLIRNSFQAVVGESTKTINVCAYASKDGKVIVDVIDSGTGIPAELKDKIFQPFFTTRQVNQGAGLGLSFSRSTIEALGGGIDVASLNRPNIIRISLPALAYLRSDKQSA